MEGKKAEEIKEKIEDIKAIFQHVMGSMEVDENIELFEQFICAYSYFISHTNKDYKYNQTYLVSYFRDFQKIKDRISKKIGFVEELKMEIDKLDIGARKITLEIDEFWRIIWEVNKRKDESLTEKINKEKLCSNDYTISVTIENEEKNKICISKKLKDVSKISELIDDINTLMMQNEEDK